MIVLVELKEGIIWIFVRIVEVWALRLRWLNNRLCCARESRECVTLGSKQMQMSLKLIRETR